MNWEVPVEQLRACIEAVQGRRVAIVGDVMLDRYQFGTVERISPEAPVPVVRVQEERFQLGGAANVASNVKSLGGEPLLLGTTGRDRALNHLQRLLQEQEIEHALVSDDKWQTTQKTRIIAQGQQVVRVDKEAGVFSGGAEGRLVEQIGLLLADAEVVVVSDYGKGTVNEEVLRAVRRSVPREAKILIDPKLANFHIYEGAYLLTPNRKEAGERSGIRGGTREDVIESGRRIMEMNRCENLLITLGPEGMALFTDSGGAWKIPTVSRKVFDVTGAGDTVIAVTALALSGGADLFTGCLLANFAAGLVVAQVGTAAVTPHELRESIEGLPAQPSMQRWQ
jgi:rfaE bifunctional protein kinase chain/domain